MLPSFNRKKKESKHKTGRQAEAFVTSEVPSEASTGPSKESSGLKMTKAEQAFFKMQEKRQMTRVMEKASKSHKKRVEEFNAHLDSLSEHYDIPKVSWTK